MLHQVLSTEKVPFTFRVAGLGARLLAWLADCGVLMVLFTAGVMAAGVLEAGKAGSGLALLVLWVFVLHWGYFLLFEWLGHGQTPGKRLAGIRVIREEGTGVGFYQSAVRNLVRFVDALPFLYGVGFVTALGNPAHRRLGDFAAGTLVVQTEARTGAFRAVQDGPVTAPPAQLLALRQRLGNLDRGQRQTLLDLCLRRDQLLVQDRAKLFRAVADYFHRHYQLAPEEYESEEKFVLRLTAALTTREPT